jgi:hypothetical protein
MIGARYILGLIRECRHCTFNMRIEVIREDRAEGTSYGAGSEVCAINELIEGVADAEAPVQSVSRIST